MDIVVRTPHGDAEVTVGDHGAAARLSTLVADVTGQAPPPVVVVDGRVVDASSTIDSAHLLRGSVIESTSETPDDAAVVVELVQVSGHGTGRRFPLVPGRYRVGPGRRSHADELSPGVVESTRATFVVGPDGSLQIGDRTIPAPSGCFEAGGRWFVTRPLEPVPPTDRSATTPDADGRLTFVRTAAGADPVLPMLTSIRRVTSQEPGLWSRRSWDSQALRVPGGLDDLGGVVHIELSERALAMRGDERFRYAAARSTIVEAATLHGPADLSVAIATTNERRSLWEWAKWLPHVRRGPGDVHILPDRAARTAWADDMAAASLQPGPADPDRPFDILLVIDDPTLWTEPEPGFVSVIRRLSGPATDHDRAGLHALLLCGPGVAVPAYCTTIVTQLDDGRATFTHGDRAVDASVSLLDEPLALDVARRLAPRRDPDLEIRATTSSPPTFGLDALLHLAGPDAVVDRWQHDLSTLPPIVIGRRDGIDATLPDAWEAITVAGRDAGAAADMAVAVIASIATALSPQALRIVPLIDTAPSRLDALWQLPHAASEAADALDPERLMARLQRVINESSGDLRHIVLVVAGARVAPMTAALERWAETIRQGPGTLQLVVVEPGDSSMLPESVSIVVDAVAGDRRATLHMPGHDEQPFEPWSPAAAPPAPEEVMARPYVLGRPMTPIERRLGEQARRADATPSADLEQVLEWCREAARRRADAPTAPQLVPHPFPDRVDGAALFADWPADAVPLGLIDRPADLEQPPLWWQPGDGSLIGIGSPRSGVAALADAVVLGLAARVAPADAELVAVCRSTVRQHATTALDHATVVVGSDHLAGVTDVLDIIEERLAPAAPGADGHDRRLVALFDDAAHTRRRLLLEPAGEDLADRFDRLLVSAAASNDVDVIAIVHDTDDAGPVAEVAASDRMRTLTAHAGNVGGSSAPVKGRVTLHPGGAAVQLIDEVRNLDADVMARTEADGDDR